MDAPDENIIGHIVAPWRSTKLENKPNFQRAFDAFVEATAKFYPNK